MAKFTVRVELHGAVENQYKMLHERMTDAGFYTIVEGESETLSGFWCLPTAEYDHTAAATAGQIRDQVLNIARSVKALPQPWVLVSQVTDRAWSTDPVAGHVRTKARLFGNGS